MRIKEEFKKLIPPLTTEEFKQIKLNCVEEGIRDSLITWNGYIIDGYNRYKIVQKHNLKFNTEEKVFDSEDDVKEWMILNQLGRRNLNSYQRSVLALELEDVFRVKAKENLSKTGGDKKSGLQKSVKPIINAVNTQKELSKVASVSHDTIDKVKKIQEKAPEEVRAKLSTGEVSINQAYQKIKKEEKKDIEDKQKQIPIINTEDDRTIYEIIAESQTEGITKTNRKRRFDDFLKDVDNGMGAIQRLSSQLTSTNLNEYEAKIINGIRQSKGARTEIKNTIKALKRLLIS